MARQVEREARYERSRVTDPERDRLILRLWKRGYSQTAIAAHVGMTQPAIHYALKRLRGMERVRVSDIDTDDEW